jgi:hypothetical protein
LSEAPSKERRAVPRESSRWRARVRKPLSVNEVEFEIRDFSQHGLFLAARDDDARRFVQSAATGLLIEVLIPDRNDEIAVHARGSVIRAEGDGLGVRLRDAARECVSFLRLIDAPTLKDAPSLDPPLAPEALPSAIGDALKRYFDAALLRYFGALDEYLFQAAQKARNPTEEGNLLRMRRLLTQERDRLGERFFAALMRVPAAPMSLKLRSRAPSWPATPKPATASSSRCCARS